MDGNFLKRAIKKLPDGVFALDSKGVVLLWNDTLEEMTGVREDNIVGKGDFEYSLAFYDEKRPMVVDYVLNPKLIGNNGYKHGVFEIETFVQKLYKGKGAWVRMSASPIFDEENNLIGAVQVIRDISIRKKAEIEMRRLYNVIEQSPVGVAIVEFSGNVIYCNESFRKSADIDTLGNINIYELFPSVTLYEIHNGYLKEFKFGKRILRLRAVRIEDEINGYALFLTDITELRKSEEQIIISNKMETVRKLTSSYAHEIKNLLTAISGYCQLGLDSNNIDDLKLNLSRISRLADTTLQNLTRILGIGKESIRTPKVVDLVVVVNEILPLITNSLRPEINISTSIENQPINIFADKNDIEKILSNLIINAQDAMPNGGNLIISLSVRQIKDIYRNINLSNEARQDFAHICIKDTGTGIEDSIKDKIFEPFFTTKGEKGTGMGLPTVYEVVRLLDGYIFFDSEVSKGARFDVFIPLSNLERCQSG
ncbi:MAG: PAS domain S-box protein [Thermodesulfovibrionales bacterium]|nr:PAS domain S-box protein [Thermodesulfovibrionales bacterium]